MSARIRDSKSQNAQQGFTALEMLVVLIVTIAALGLGAQYLSGYADNLTNQSAAEHQKTVSDAAVQYIKDHYAALLGAASPTRPAVVTVPMLKRTGYLPAAFSDQNPFGQEYRVLALKPAEKKLETLIVSTGGETIPELGIRRIAQLVGARGGFISSKDVTYAQGSYGGWRMPLSNYHISPGAGHLATALFFDDAALTSDYLYRNPVAGHPELNRMNTALDMGGHDVKNGGWVSVKNVDAEIDVRAMRNVYAQGDIISEARTISYGYMQAKGGLYSHKDVHAIGNISSEKHIQANGWIQANGRLVAGEYLQINGVAREGYYCWPTGLIGRSSTDGNLLACQNDNIWRSPHGLAFTGWQQVGLSGYTEHSGLLVATSCHNCPLVGYTSGVPRFAISQRDKYGQGKVSGTMPIMRGETWGFYGAEQVWLMSFRD
ncbi:Type IV pilus protein PilV [Candidatus Glomeribacter gigasporarum BEG34]|uniref:Type IV pilus protein PilV n=1 Tax=Candidatus Glomeribacter gigasporarum BEG34 TaxID=1070319 RepID=G2J987_9BURK|nr:shufflon system plasmid conjugative transfer pilus tip adhesin PilV [Candidatus Glomeribacter gigasporarum]CCD29334.1 Type IV pilus protein PilV [Candidatus Glomeribacter gigasporarum BEG34]